MSSAIDTSLGSVPAGFETLPVFAQGQVIPGASPKGVLGANGIRAYCHTASAVRIVIFAAPGPLVSSTIIVGTEPISNAGHPHTLEHIVFLGSKNHPHRGYLDNLACRCISDGTNAWTDKEFTAYTATTAGLEGFLNLLPCYLDHILRPIINRAAFDSEVYHIGKDAKEAGVVFCEMQARENTEADLSDFALHGQLFENTPLALSSGGLCNQIRTLSNEDIVRFHRDQYCGANVSVVVGGSDIPSHALLSSVKPLLDEIAASPGYHPGAPRWQNPLKVPPLPPLTRNVLPFPSSDESIGSISMAWRGPSTLESKDKTTIDILLRYLADDVWSPLRQRYVEVEDQLSSDIYSYQETFLDVGSFTLSFQGVDHRDDDDNVEDDEDDDDSYDANEDANEEEMGDQEKENTNGELAGIDGPDENGGEEESFLLSGNLERDVMSFLESICDSGQLPGGFSAILVAIKKERESLLTELESGSHSAVPHHLLDELVYRDRGSLVIGQEARNFLTPFDVLKNTDEAYWISALKRFFVDAPRIELVMVPNAKLAEKHAENETLALDDRFNRIGKDALAKMATENEARIATLKAVKFKANLFPPIPSTMNITRFPYSVSRQKRSCYAGQALALETDFVHCTIFLDTKRLKLEERMLLPILCELIPTCDILLDDGCYTPYTDHARAYSEATISSDISGEFLGYSNGMASQCVIIHFAASPESFEEAAELMLASLFQSEVTVERVSATAQTLMANCTAEMREGDSVQSAQSVLLPYVVNSGMLEEDLPNYVISNFIASLPLVTFLSEEFSSKKPKKHLRQKIVRKFQDVLTTVRNLGREDVFVQITAREPEAADKMLASMWANKVRKYGRGGVDTIVDLHEEVGIDNLPISRRLHHSLEQLLNGRTVGKITGIGGVDSSFLEVNVNSHVFVGHSDWGALSVLNEMLCRIEGPLSDAVRVSGLAYGTQIENATWLGHLSLEIYESSSLAAAWDAVCRCLEDFRIRLDGCDDDGLLAVELDTAKASMLYNLNRARSSPESIGLGTISRCALGVPASPMADQALEEEIERVSLGCLKRVFDSHLRRVYEGQCSRLVVVVCGESAVRKTIEEFNECKRPVCLEECSVQSMVPNAAKKFVTSLAS